MTLRQERRRSTRYAVECPARLAAGADSLEVRVRDICRDAALLEANRWLLLHTEVRLELQLPGVGETVAIAGRVIRIEPGDEGSHRMAVLFADLPVKEQVKLDLFFAEQEAGE